MGVQTVVTAAEQTEGIYHLGRVALNSIWGIYKVRLTWKGAALAHLLVGLAPIPFGPHLGGTNKLRPLRQSEDCGCHCTIMSCFVALGAGNLDSAGDVP